MVVLIGGAGDLVHQGEKQKHAGGDACGPRENTPPTGATHCDGTGTPALRGEKLLRPLCLVNVCAYHATGPSQK